MEDSVRESRDRVSFNDVPDDIIRVVASYNPEVAVALSLISKKFHRAVTCDEKLWCHLMNGFYYQCKYVEGQDWRKRIINLVSFPPTTIPEAVSYDDIKTLIFRGEPIDIKLLSTEIPQFLDRNGEELLSKFVVDNAITRERANIGTSYIFPLIIKHLIYPKPETVQAMMDSPKVIKSINDGGVTMEELLSYLDQTLKGNIKRRAPIDRIAALKCYEVLFSKIGSNLIYLLYHSLGNYIRERYKITGKFNNAEYLKKLFGSWTTDQMQYGLNASIIGKSLMTSCIVIGDKDSVEYLLSIGVPITDMNDLEDSKIFRPFTVEFFDFLMGNGFRLRRQRNDQDYVIKSREEYENLTSNSQALLSIVETNDIDALDHIIEEIYNERPEKWEYSLLLSGILSSVIKWKDVNIATIRYLCEDRGAKVIDSNYNSILLNCIRYHPVILKYLIDGKKLSYRLRWDIIPDKSEKLTNDDIVMLVNNLGDIGKVAIEIFADENKIEVRRFESLIDNMLDVNKDYIDTGRSLYQELERINNELSDAGFPSGRNERNAVLKYLKQFIEN